MNVLEETPSVYTIKVTGLSARQIKDIFENEYGALMWNNGYAEPTSGVFLQFVKSSALAARKGE